MSDFRQNSLFTSALRRFWNSPAAKTGTLGIILLLFPALYSPLLINQRPLIMLQKGVVSFPFLRYIFSPESPEILVEQFFNFSAIYLMIYLLFALIKFRRVRKILQITAFALLLIPFIFTEQKMERINYRQMAENGEIKAIFAQIKIDIKRKLKEEVSIL